VTGPSSVVPDAFERSGSPTAVSEDISTTFFRTSGAIGAVVNSVLTAPAAGEFLNNSVTLLNTLDTFVLIFWGSDEKDETFGKYELILISDTFIFDKFWNKFAARPVAAIPLSTCLEKIGAIRKQLDQKLKEYKISEI
jgi:hypothetical protein